MRNAADDGGTAQGNDTDDASAGRCVADGGVRSQSGGSNAPAAPPGSAPATDGDADQESAEQSSAAEAVEPLSLDVVFEIAKNERRRRVLHYLLEEETPVQLGELAEHIAAAENDKEVSALTSAERKRVYVGLYQCHLPKMDDAGVINFERNPGITPGPNVADVARYLDVNDEAGRAWSRYYLALSTGALVVLGLAFLAGNAAVTTLASVAATVSLFGLACLHAWDAESS